MINFSLRSYVFPTMFILYAAGLFAIPIYFIELYPWTHNPMFSMTYQGYSEVKVFDAKERKISPEKLNIHAELNWNPLTFPPAYTNKSKIRGSLHPFTINTNGKRLEKKEVKRHIVQHESFKEMLKPLRVTIVHYGLKENGSFGITEKIEFNVSEK